MTKTTWGDGSSVLQFERMRLQRDAGGFVSSNMERGSLIRLVTWIRSEIKLEGMTTRL